MENLLNNTLELALASAPWLVFGLVAAGLIRAWLPMSLVGSSLGGSGFAPVLRAALIGAPLPLCSCGTLPAAFSLRRAGASKASTTSFLIATPETGVDSVALSWVLLGPVLALIRPFAAIFSAVCAGWLVGRADEANDAPLPLNGEVEEAPSCASTGCCSCDEKSEAPEPQVEDGLLRRTGEGLKYAFTDLLDDLALWLFVGILAAGLVVTLVPANLLAEWGSGLPAMLLIMLISVPMYVCATASTPLAHAMLFAGVSPGTVLVFLLAGPASNLAGIALVKKELGERALVAYLVGVGVISVLLGLLLDQVVNLFEFDLLAGMIQSGGGEHEFPLLFSMACLLFLMACSIKPVRRYLAGGKVKDDGCCG